MTKQIPINNWDRLRQAVLQGASDLTERMRGFAKRISDVARNGDLTPAKERPIEKTASGRSVSFNRAMFMLGALEPRGESGTFIKWWLLAGALFLITLVAYPKIAPWIQRLMFRSHLTLTQENLKRIFEGAAALNLKTEDYQNGKDYRLQTEQGNQANEIVVFGLMCDGSVVKTPSVEVLIETNTIVLKVIAKTVRPLGPTPDQIYAAILNVLWQSKAVPVWIRFQISSSIENAIRWVVNLESADLVSSDEKRQEKEFRKRIEGGPGLTLDQRFSWQVNFKGKKNRFPTAHEMLQKVDRLQGVEFLQAESLTGTLIAVRKTRPASVLHRVRRVLTQMGLRAMPPYLKELWDEASLSGSLADAHAPSAQTVLASNSSGKVA